MELSKKKAAPIPQMRIVGPELMAMVAQGEGLLETSWKRREASEMVDPLLIGERPEAYTLGPALVAVAEDVLREFRRTDNIIEIRTKFLMLCRGAINGGAGHGRYPVNSCSIPTQPKCSELPGQTNP